jgi:hypothetical protein
MVRGTPFESRSELSRLSALDCMSPAKFAIPRRDVVHRGVKPLVQLGPQSQKTNVILSAAKDLTSGAKGIKH